MPVYHLWWQHRGTWWQHRGCMPEYHLWWQHRGCMPVYHLWWQHRGTWWQHHGCMPVYHLWWSRTMKIMIKWNQLVQQMPLALDDLVTFQTFCSAASWLSKANVETKLRGLYQTLTFNSPLNQGTLQLLLQDVYPSDTSESISQLSQLLLREIDSKHQGYIDEDQFVTWIWKLPQDAVKSILDFPIIPQGVIAASKDQPSSSVKVAAPQETSAVTDAQLFRIASEMSAQKRDWKLLANHLGFLEKDSHAFEGRHSEVNQQISEMLQAWQRKEGPLTEASALQSALQASGNTDISNEVFQLSF
ncbi:uncharacterized protein LOC119963772 [Scyliorhinus canicula]|uniref:uncharacterized protein LOC119963772 n=1 Tax=Scyliorhinus canicula TaxID=7830 RepID=UPI0018F38C49|nr:uncharacterized protein LOC119963772 [Scyliorhinus canicula]